MCQFCHSIQEEQKQQEEFKKLCNSLDLPPAIYNENYMSKSLHRLAEVGRRLSRGLNDNYALAESMKVLLNQVNLAERNHKDYYRKFFPRDADGKIKEITFKSTYFCQTEKSEFITLFWTKSGKVTRNGIRNCGRGWFCPICGAKISARRNLEVRKILNKAHKMKKSVYMLTLTAPHYSYDPLLSLCERMQAALDDFHNSFQWRDIKNKYKFFGSIRAMETTIGGSHGPHNHFHIILIFSSCIINSIAAKIKARFLYAWEAACRKNNLLLTNAGFAETMQQLEDFHKHGVDLKRDFDPDYIVKQSLEWRNEMRVSPTWTASEELTLSHLKKKRDGVAKTDSDKGGFTPFGFVANMSLKAAFGTYSATEFNEDAEKVIEYCCAMHGRKQLLFSEGLRKWAGLDEGKNGQGKSDESLCNEMTDHGMIIGGFDVGQHRLLRRKIALKQAMTILEKYGPVKGSEIISQFFKNNGLRGMYSKEDAIFFLKMSEHNLSSDDDFKAFSKLQKEIHKNNRASRDIEIEEDMHELEAREREKIAEEEREEGKAKFEQIPLDFDEKNDIENDREHDEENAAPIIDDCITKITRIQGDKCAHLGWSEQMPLIKNLSAKIIKGMVYQRLPVYRGNPSKPKVNREINGGRYLWSQNRSNSARKQQKSWKPYLKK